MTKYKQGILSGAAAATVTAVVMLLLLSPFSQTQNNEIDYSPENGKNQNAIKHEKPPVIGSYKSDDMNNNRQNAENANIEKVKTVVKYVYLPAKDSEENTKSAGLNKDVNGSELPSRLNIQPFEKQISKSGVFVSEKINLADNFKPKAINSKASQFFDRIVSPIRIEFRGHQPFFLSDTKIMPREYQLFNNTSFGGYSFIKDRLEFGTEIRFENFYQTFTGEKANGNLYRYAQQPNVASVNLALRYYPEWADFDKYHGFIQFSAGGSELGPITRLMLGASYKASENVNFYLGIEPSLLIFRHRDNWFGSTKTGINYGVSYQFD